KEYERAIELDPNYAVVHLRYASYLEEMGQMERTYAEIEKAYDLDPPGYLLLLAEVSVIKGDYGIAIERFKRVIELDDNNWIARSELGLTYLTLGRNDEGIIEIQKAVDLSGRSNSSLSSLGYAYAV